MSLKILNSKLKIIIAVLFLFAAITPFSKAEAAWLTGWSNRRAVTIDNTAGSALTDYQVSVDTTNSIYNENGLVGSWHFSEGTGTAAADSSGNYNNGTITGATWSAGKFGSGLSFNGSNNYVRSASAINLGNNFTISFWMNPTTLHDYGDPISFGTTDFHLTFVTYADGHMFFDVGNGSSWGNAVSTSAGTFVNGNWYHIVGIANGTTIQLFVNGVSKGTAVNSYSVNDVINIGARTVTSYYFNGLIDEVGVYNRALSISEIADLYNASKARLDYADVRFTNEDGSTLIDHWQESDKKSWVEVPSISAASQKTIYMYYGNASASSASNGTNTFIFFDTGNDIAGWTVSGTVSDNSIGLPPPSYNTPFSSVVTYMYRNVGLAPNSIIEYNQQLTGAGRSIGNFFFLVNSSGVGQAFNLDNLNGAGDHSNWYNTTSWTGWSVSSDTGFNPALNTWYKMKLVLNSSVAQMSINDSILSPTYSFANNGGYIGLVSDGGVAHNSYWDNLRVRKYTTTEPTTSIYGEQNNITYSVQRGIKIDNTSGGALYDYQIPVDITSAVYDNTGLVGSWHFNEGQGSATSDMSGNYNTGTLVNNPTWTTGKFGSGLSFDGVDDKVEISDPTTDLSSAFTVSYWVRMKAGASGEYTPMVEKNGSTSAAYGAPFDFRSSNDAFPKDLTIGYGKSGIANFVDVADVFPQDTWVHIVGTFDNVNGLKAYKNGVLIGSNSTVTNVLDENQKIMLAQRLDNLGYSAIDLDEVRIYNRALSATEISDLYNASKLKLDYSDIRFTDTSASYNDQSWTYSYSYWLESDKKAWVKVPSIAASTQKTIYMYYGNTNATSTSNIFNTFIFGDDFNDGLINSNWVNGDGAATWVESGGVMTKTAGTAGGRLVVPLSGSYDYIVDALVRPNTWGSDYRMGIMGRYAIPSSDNLGHIFTVMYNNQGQVVDLNEGIAWGTAVSPGFTFATGNWYNFKVLYTGTSAMKGKSWTIGSGEPAWQKEVTFGTSRTERGVGLYSAVNSFASFDNFRVRKYTATEPTITLLALAIDCGVRAYDGTGIITFGCEPSGILTSALRVYDGFTIYGIKLVEITDPSASKFRIKTSSGIKAIMKL